MSRSLKIAKLAGINVYIHWSFTLLLAYVAYISFSEQFTIYETLFVFALVGCLFFCIVLHELGHSLAARRYGIETDNITLLLIGGVAQLERMPEKPKQELIVAVAGPAVNLIIAFVLGITLLISYIVTYCFSIDSLLYSIFNSFLLSLLGANCVLVLFNAIPAFPMDGGRVFRSLLAMKIGRLKATVIAARVGQVIAVLFAIAGIFWLSNPFLVLVALFVIFVASGEEKMVKAESVLGEKTVKEMMLIETPLISVSDSLQTVVQLMKNLSTKNFLVTDQEEIIGSLNQKHIKAALSTQKPDTTLVSSLVDRKMIHLEPNMLAKEAYQLMNINNYLVLPILENKQVIGFVDREKIARYIQVMLAKK